MFFPARCGWGCARSLRNRKVGRLAGGEQRGRDQHGHRHEVGGAIAARLRPAHVGEAGAQADQSAHITEAPAPARDPSQGVLPRQFRQERGNQVLAAAVEKIGKHEQQDRQPQVARPGAGEGGGERHAADCGGEQQAFFRGVGIGIRAQQRRRQHDQRVGERQRQSPGQRCPGGVSRHHRDEIGVEDGGDDDGGVAGIGEIVHRPGPGFAEGDIGCEVVAHGLLRSMFHDNYTESWSIPPLADLAVGLWPGFLRRQA